MWVMVALSFSRTDGLRYWVFLYDIPEHCDILVALEKVCQAAAIPQVEEQAQILSLQAVTAQYISDLRPQHAHRSTVEIQTFPVQ